jgi:hypothetical protein
MKRSKSAPRVRVVQGASGRQEVLTEDGPPDIQTLSIRIVAPKVNHGMALKDAGSLSFMPAPVDSKLVEEREPTVIKTEWRDTEDSKAHLRRFGAKYVTGWKRTNTIEVLHKSSPHEITERHVKASKRLADDYEMSNGYFAGRAPMGGDAVLDPIEVRIAAARRYEEAMQAIGLECALVVFYAGVDWRSLSWIEDRMGVNRKVLLGMLSAGLSRLRDHYSPPTSVSSVATIVATLIDPDTTHIPQERLGRFRRLTPA